MPSGGPTAGRMRRKRKGNNQRCWARPLEQDRQVTQSGRQDRCTSWALVGWREAWREMLVCRLSVRWAGAGCMPTKTRPGAKAAKARETCCLPRRAAGEDALKKPTVIPPTSVPLELFLHMSAVVQRRPVLYVRAPGTFGKAEPASLRSAVADAAMRCCSGTRRGGSTA